jgi:hypothetical protein
MLFAGHQIVVQFRYKMHELHLTNNNIFYTLIVSTNRYLDHLRLLEEKMWGENWVFLREFNFHNILFFIMFVMLFPMPIDSLALISIRIKGRRALEDQGASISKTKRRDQIRSRTKRYKTIAIGTARIGKVSTFYNSLSIFYNSLLDWDQVGKAIKRIRGTFEEKEKEYKTFVTEGVYCWRWHCCRLNKIYHQRWGSHRVGNVYKLGQSWYVGRPSQERLDWGLKLPFDLAGI